MRSEQPDYYKILGVDTQATTDAIRDAFAELRVKMMAETPDIDDDPDFQQKVQAYEVLSNPERRAVYDALLAETWSPVLDVDALLSREQIGISDTAQLVYLLASIQPPTQEIRAHLPLNLCLVVDRSTSMRGIRLDRVKAAVELIIEKLSPDDNLAVVSFSDRAEIILPSGSISNIHVLLAKIRGMTASGGTEIYQGLEAGIKEMQQVPLKQYTNHLILLTDGHTYGDVEQCLKLARETAPLGIGISAFGIGSEWNDQFLDKLVEPSGGQSGYIEAPEQIIEYLQKRIKGLGAIYAQNLRLVSDFPKSVNLRYGFKLAPYAQPLVLSSKEIRLGDVEGRSPLTFLLELSIEPQSIETRIKIPLVFIANIPAQQMQERTFKHQIQILVLASATPLEPPPAILKAVRMLNMYRMNEKVWEEVEAGELEKATTRMHRLTTRLLEAGETQLAQQAQMEAQRLSTVGSLSLEGRKRLKYGTRTLIGQIVPLDTEQDDNV